MAARGERRVSRRGKPASARALHQQWPDLLGGCQRPRAGRVQRSGWNHLRRRLHHRGNSIDRARRKRPADVLQSARRLVRLGLRRLYGSRTGPETAAEKPLICSCSFISIEPMKSEGAIPRTRSPLWPECFARFHRWVFRPQWILAVSACWMALGLCGCVSPNTRHAQFGRVAANAHLEKGTPTYNELEIYEPLDVLTPQIWLRLPDGRVLDKKWFSYATLKQAGFTGSDEKDFEPGSIYTHELSRYGVSFFFSYGTLKMIRLSKTQGPAVSFGRENGTLFYTMPLTQEQLEQLFGHPEKVSDKFEL